jgi:hypothetical protein
VAPDPPPAEPAPPDVEAGVGQAGWVNVLPGSDCGGTAPALPRAAARGLWVPLRLLTAPPPPEPLPPPSGRRTSSPPVKTVELTWTSAERRGGTATAIAVSEAAAARPPTRRAQPTRVGRMACGTCAAQLRQVASRKFSGRAASTQ